MFCSPLSATGEWLSLWGKRKDEIERGGGVNRRQRKWERRRGEANGRNVVRQKAKGVNAKRGEGGRRVGKS